MKCCGRMKGNLLWILRQSKTTRIQHTPLDNWWRPHFRELTQSDFSWGVRTLSNWSMACFAGCSVSGYPWVATPVLPPLWQTNRQTDRHPLPSSPNISSKLRLDRSSQERLTLSQAITWCLSLSTSVANWKLFCDNWADKPGDQQCFPKLHPHAHATDSSTPGRKNKSASSAEDGRGRGGRKGHGALKETRRKTHKRAKRTLSAFPTLFLIKENTTKRKQSLGSLQRDLWTEVTKLESNPVYLQSFFEGRMLITFKAFGWTLLRLSAPGTAGWDLGRWAFCRLSCFYHGAHQSFCLLLVFPESSFWSALISDSRGVWHFHMLVLGAITQQRNARAADRICFSTWRPTGQRALGLVTSVIDGTFGE